MLIKPLLNKALYHRHQESQRRSMAAKLNGDVETEAQVYKESVALRKALKGIKYKSLNPTSNGN
jgi:hypothetical protein